MVPDYNWALLFKLSFIMVCHGRLRAAFQKCPMHKRLLSLSLHHHQVCWCTSHQNKWLEWVHKGLYSEWCYSWVHVTQYSAMGTLCPDPLFYPNHSVEVSLKTLQTHTLSKLFCLGKHNTDFNCTKCRGSLKKALIICN